MSGSTIGGVVGGAIGFYFGGPQGAQIGWMIGSAVGGYVDPEKIQGPRLTDAVRQTAQAGIPITFGYGTFPTTGNIIWIQPGPPTEIRTQERTGKGGGPVQIAYTYTRSYAIGICEGEITGLLVIKRNGKVVYDARSDAVLSAAGMTAAQISASRGASAAFLAKCTIYTGSETQVADPTIEAWEGVGNVPGHRGMAYVVVHDDDVTELRGAVPQYEFVVAKSGTVGEGTVGADVAALSNTGSLSFGSGTEWPGPYLSPSGDVVRLAYIDGAAGGVLVGYGVNGGYYSYDRGDTWTAIAETIGSENQVARISAARWAMVGHSNKINTTSTGTSWTSATISGGSFGALKCIGGHSDLVVTGDNDGRVKRSTDLAVTFTSPALTVMGTGAVTAVSRSNNELHTVVIANENGGMAYWDTNTLAWIGISTPFAGQVTAIYYANFKYVAVSPVSGIAYSDNGVNWTLATNPGIAPRDVTYTNGVWVIGGGVGGSDAAIATSADGVTWTMATESFTGDYIHSVAGVPCSGAAIPDAPGWYVLPDGSLCGPSEAPIETESVALGQIVADLFERVGIPSTAYDVSQLTDLVPGYRIASEGGVDSYVAPLMQAYFFDVGEWDGKLRCIKRGGASALTLTADDLAEKEGDAIEQTRVQEAELLRKVTVGYLDPVALYTPFTQEWERRSATVEAKGEGTVQVPVVMSGTTAAQVAEKRGKAAWSEPDKFKFCLPYRRAKVTPTDVVTLYDFDGLPHRVRVMGVEEDSGVLHIEGVRDRQAAYTGTASGVAPTPITPPGAPLIGPTQLVVLNLPVLRDADDGVGVYVAGRGYFSGWTGGLVQVSTDSGTTFSSVGEITVASTIGYTVTDFAAGDATLEDTQSLTVWLPDAPESVDYATLLRYTNRAAIQSDSGAWEVVQYQTVVDEGDGFYTLSGFIRGRYDTTAGAAAGGATFVLIDSSLQFIPTERWMIGQTLQVRAVSYGTDSDAAVAESFAFTTCASQTEWQPFMVAATRDGSNNVTVTGYARARLGVDTSPYHSDYFTGARITYSDGNTYDVTPDSTGYFTHTRNSTPASQTITAAALNSITGAGPASTGITV